MPVYDYKCKKCKVEVEVIRSISECDTPPGFMEVPQVAQGTVCDPHESHDWQKLIKGNIGVAATWAFRRHGMKGNWIYLIAIIGQSICIL